MFLQGHLQLVFDALFKIGAIDPILKADWAQLTEEMSQNPAKVKAIFNAVNGCSHDFERLENLMKRMDEKALKYLAMEVAREFAEFQDRQSLH